jgi:hypothetical protein
MPDNIASIIQHEEQNPIGKPVFFFVEFGGGNLDVSQTVPQVTLIDMPTTAFRWYDKTNNLSSKLRAAFGD